MDCFQPGPLFPGNERTILTSSPTATPAEAPVPGIALAEYNPTAEPTSTITAVETMDAFFMAPPLLS
jgi:hypothetical protein